MWSRRMKRAATSGGRSAEGTGKTMIFLDEIQECQEAVTSLKFWAADNRFDVLASGSLLGIDYKRASSYPVGYVDYLKMYGLDFEEFLWGMGISQDLTESLSAYLHTKTVIPEAIHSRMMHYYRQYTATGGMPEAVQKYVDTRDFRTLTTPQRAGKLSGGRFGRTPQLHQFERALM